MVNLSFSKVNHSEFLRRLSIYFEDDNRLIGGNPDNGGLANVNYNWSDNRNVNIGFRPLVVSHLTILIQPPNILPISIICDVSCWYLLLSRHFVSKDRRMRIFNRSSLTLTLLSVASFLSRGKYRAKIISSISSSEIISRRSPRVKRLTLGK